MKTLTHEKLNTISGGKCTVKNFAIDVGTGALLGAAGGGIGAAAGAFTGGIGCLTGF